MDLDFERENKFKQFIGESKLWYSATYLEEITFVRRLIVLFILLLIVITLSSNFLNQQDKEIVVYFPLLVEDNSDDLYNIRSIDLPKASIEEEIANYMAKRYLILRESYSPLLLEPNEWERVLQNIAGLSSYEIFEEFLNGVLPNKNNKSPILKYRLQRTATPIIKNVIFTKFIAHKPFAAEMNFTLKLCDLSFTNCNEEDWTARMEFEMSSINDFTSFDQAFRFKILHYKSEPLLRQE